MTIREASHDDLSGLLHLYAHLKPEAFPVLDQTLQQLWNRILQDPDHHILVAPADNRIISSCVLVVIPNLTHAQRPWALIENVVTHPEHRNRGCASRLLNAARDIAIENNCYKIMLMTGSKEETTLRFYERAGYNRHDKTAFIQWLN